MTASLAIQHVEGAWRSRAHAFLPAEIVPDFQGGLYQSLYKRLRDFILDGVWPPGTRLPSSRALAADLRVSRNTAILAVDQLIADGWAESRSRSGVYVSVTHAVIPPRQDGVVERDLLPFAPQRPATDLFPALIWKQLQSRAWAQVEPQRMLDADPAGDPGLREAIARLVCAPRGLRCHADQIVIVPTATAAFDLIAATLLQPGDRVMVENPGRPVVRRVLQGRGARICAVPVGNAGLCMDAMIRSAGQARLACIAPTVQFPTCTTMSADVRTGFLDWARTGERWLIEDDRDAEAWFDRAPAPPPLAAEDRERVILVGSFNRVLFPGLCVSFLMAPTRLVEQLRAVQAVAGGRASLSSQMALRDFIVEGHFARHLRRRRDAYGERRRAMLDCLEAAPAARDCSAINRAGLHLVMNVGAGRAARLSASLAANGLGGAAMDDFAVGGGADEHLLIGLGGTPEVIGRDGPRVAAAIAAGILESAGER